MNNDESPPYAGNEDMDENQHYVRNYYDDSWWDELYRNWDFEDD